MRRRRRRSAALTAALLALPCLACGAQGRVAGSARDATLGFAPSGFDPSRACGRWRQAVTDPTALWHDARPELNAAACFVRVVHAEGAARADPTPAGCGYPEPGSDPRPELLAEATRLEAATRVASADERPSLGCALRTVDAAQVAARNARVLRALARRLEERHYPYGAIATFGYGHPSMAESVLVGRSPEAPCTVLSREQAALLSVMRTRAGRAAAAFHGGVAPVVIATGGAVHSPLVEAFALDHLLRCWFSVPAERVLLEPCADHTHTNIRNTGAWLVALGARTGYLVTDDGLQGQYLAEPGVFKLLGASVDQRALAAWGSSLGSYHRASVGILSGFWYTPYRFWAEPRDGAGSLTCVR